MSNSGPNSLLNALIGAVVTVVLSFTVISPILGGALAGYLEKENGVRIGAIAGVIAVVPLVLFFLLAVFGIGFFVVGGPGVGLFGLFALVFAFTFGLAFVIGLSALGGYLGVYLATEYGN